MSERLSAPSTLVQVINAMADQIEQARQIKSRLDRVVHQITGIGDDATNPVPPSPTDYIITERLMWQAGMLSSTMQDINRRLNQLECGIGDAPQPAGSTGAAVMPMRR